MTPNCKITFISLRNIAWDCIHRKIDSLYQGGKLVLDHESFELESLT